MNLTAHRERCRDRTGGYPVAANAEDHLVAAIEWLVRAHHATRNGGVSRGYGVGWHPYFRNRWWQPADPQTTGYLILTVYGAARRLDRPDLRERAVRMADWELQVQLPSGAVQSGMIREQLVPTPALFNAGKVLFRVVRAHMETGRDEYLSGARRAADYMVRAQRADGRFEQGQCAVARDYCTTYYTRAA